MSDLGTAIRTILVDCLAVRPAENVLVLTDPTRRAIAEALVEQARALGAETLLMEMAARETHGTEPPPAVAAALLECSVAVAPTSKSISHTEARHAASARGVRIATMPEITEDLLVRTMGADYSRIKERSLAVAARLTQGSEARITTDAGTDVTLHIAGREGIADTGDLTQPGAFGNLPAGEGFIAPVEGKTAGRIVFDGSIWPIGALQEPLVVDVEDGYAVSFEGPAAGQFRSRLEPYGREAFAVAELGIGTHDEARLGGNVLEDEKILGTIHIAFGDNHSFGGSIRVPSHQDGIVLSPRVTIDGDTILEGGRLLIR
jgi:leucyl aminopeptidase (aminopeptidase T)